jgi:parallel beta-helix repeat protein
LRKTEILIIGLFSFFGILLFFGSTQAATYYVATTGNDANPGTQAQSWKTIQKAANTMVGGDTVYIRAGTYNEQVALYYKENSSGPYTTFTAYPGEEVILDGTGISIQYGGGLFHVWHTDYIRVDGLKVQNSNGAGIYVAYANNIEVKNNRTHDTVKSGVSTWGSSNVVIEDNDISLACNPHPGYGQSEENISVDNSSYVEIRGNHVHDGPVGLNQARAGGEGINVKNGSSNVRVYNNVVNNLDKLAFGLDAWTSDTYNVEYFGNIAYNCYYGFIVSSEQGAMVENVKVYNNIAYNITRAGFSIPWWSGTADALKRNIQFINNTSYNNGQGFWNQSPLNENVIVRNNIFIQNGTNVLLVSGSEAQITFDNNLFFGSGGTYGTNQVTGDPLFVNPTGADFHLQNGSPAIDAGVDTSGYGVINDYDGNSRPRGAGYDIGAYEYLSAIPPSPYCGDGSCNGTEACSSCPSDCGTCPDATSPLIPTNLTVTAVSSTQINLSWAASTDNVGVNGYRIYRGGTQIATSTTNSYQNTGLSSSTTYTYTVAAYDVAGNVSNQSNTVSATTQAAQSQQQPQQQISQQTQEQTQEQNQQQAQQETQYQNQASSANALLGSNLDVKVYEVINNTLIHWIPSPGVFTGYGFNWNNIKVVSNTELNKYQRVKLLRAQGDAKVYYLTEAGQIRHIPNPEIFNSYNNKWEEIITVSQAEINSYPVSDLIRLAGDTKVYKLENYTKRWIETTEVFNQLKYDWTKIAPVNQVELDYYTEGVVIK